MADLIDRKAAIDAVDTIGHIATMPDGDKCIRGSAVKYVLSMLPPTQSEYSEGLYVDGYNDGYRDGMKDAQQETTKRIVGKSRDGMTLWYQCEMCNEPVDAQDEFCCGCGRRLTDG